MHESAMYPDNQHRVSSLTNRIRQLTAPLKQSDGGRSSPILSTPPSRSRKLKHNSPLQHPSLDKIPPISPPCKVSTAVEDDDDSVQDPSFPLLPPSTRGSVIYPHPLPSNIHPAVAPYFVERAYQQGKEDSKEHTYSELNEMLKGEYHAGYVDGLNFVLEHYKDYLPERTAMFISRIAAKESPTIAPSPILKLPVYEKALDFVDDLNRNRQNYFNIGIFNGRSLIADLCGFVSCRGSASKDLVGEGVLTISHSAHVKEELESSVLGRVRGTGTGILMDINGDLWLYKTPNSVDAQVLDLNYAACRIGRNRNDMVEGREIMVDCRIEDASFVRNPDEMESEESESDSEFQW